MKWRLTTRLLGLPQLGKRYHPTLQERAITEVFAEEQSCLRPVATPFDGYFEQTNRVASTYLVSYDRNRYSVPAEHAGQRLIDYFWKDP
ncbi:Mu transposase domain-containing protein [Nitrosospira lacus]|uniref:Mu transposase domain-containing protein n=1 Tax=Nitrosospira lacus TaxID=1288494 RepID=UPI000594A740|nr:hypothetical protein [Nitrosospira lacus]